MTSPINPVVWWLLVVPALLLVGAASELRRLPGLPATLRPAMPALRARLRRLRP